MVGVADMKSISGETPDRFTHRRASSDRFTHRRASFERMLPLRTFSLWMLVFLQQRLSSVGHRTGGGSVAPRGRFNTSDHMRCMWTANDEDDSVTLGVRCLNTEAGLGGRRTDLRCEYRGRPQSCPAFRSDPRGFWKQVGRALKKLRAKMCRDERALVRAGMCKRAPRDAHFQLDANSLAVSAQSAELVTKTPTPTPAPGTKASRSCTGRAEHRSTVEEYCSSAWASMCSFLLSMVQTDPC